MRATVLTVLASLLVGFVLIELFLRFDDYSSLVVDYVYHEWEGRERRTMASADQLADPREAIVLLGDSMVAGVNCGREQNLAGHLETAIEPLAPGYKTINLGTANSSVYAYLDQLLGYEAVHGPPTGLITMLYTNDVEVVEPRMCPVLDIVDRAEGVTPEEKAEARLFCKGAVFGEAAQSKPKGWFSIGGPIDLWLHDVSYAHRFFRQVAAQLAARIGGGEPIGRLRYPGLWSEREGQAFRMISAGLKEIKAVADRHDVRLMVAFYPPVEFLSTDNPMYDATEKARQALSDELGMPVLNGFDAYLDNPRAERNMSRSLTDHHPSCAAHQLLAEWLAQKFDELGGFDQQPRIAETASN